MSAHETAMTDEATDAMLQAGNERLRLEAERIRRESATLARETEQIRQQNRVLRGRLERKRRLASHLAQALAAAQDDEDAEMDAETIAALERGFADMEANRTFSLDEVRTRTDAALAAR